MTVKTVRIMVLLFMLCLSSGVFAQEYTQKGTTFYATATQKDNTFPIKTKYTWEDTDKKTYTILLSKNGRAYIKKLSKSGKTYNKYLGEEISRNLSKKYKIEYKQLINKQ